MNGWTIIIDKREPGSVYLHEPYQTFWTMSQEHPINMWLAFAKKICFYILQNVWNVFFLQYTQRKQYAVMQNDIRAKSILKKTNNFLLFSYVKELQKNHQKRLEKPRKKPRNWKLDQYKYMFFNLQENF